MGVWITGDIHGDPARFGSSKFKAQKEFNENKDENVMIVCGDFGLVWKREEDKQEKYWLDWLEDKPFTTVFVDGNHENHARLATFPVKDWNGGKVHELRPNVLHLMRGEVYTIQGKTFFAFGGASSHDVQDGILDYEDEDWKQKAVALQARGRYMFRVKGLSWWEEELPSGQEMQNGLDNLAKVGNKVDFIVTHSPSTSEQILMGGNGLYKQDVLTEYLDEVMAKTKFKRHYFGHMHVNKIVGANSICLFEDIEQIV